MASNSSGRPSTRAILARCRSPWQRRTKPCSARCRSSGCNAVAASRLAASSRSMTAVSKSAHGAKLRSVAFDDGGNGGKPALAIRPRRAVVALPDRIGHRRRQRRVDRLRRRDAVERLAVVEPRHLDRPFGRRSPAVDFEGAVGLTRNGDDAPVELGGVAGIDLQLFLTGPLAFFQCRIVEERQAAGPLDLQNPIGAKKNHRGMGVDPLAAARRTEAGAVEEIETCRCKSFSVAAFPSLMAAAPRRR